MFSLLHEQHIQFQPALTGAGRCGVELHILDAFVLVFGESVVVIMLCLLVLGLVLSLVLVLVLEVGEASLLVDGSPWDEGGIYRRQRRLF